MISLIIIRISATVNTPAGRYKNSPLLDEHLD